MSFWKLTVGFTDGSEVATRLWENERVLEQVSRIRERFETPDCRYAWWSVQSNNAFYEESEE